MGWPARRSGSARKAIVSGRGCSGQPRARTGAGAFCRRPHAAFSRAAGVARSVGGSRRADLTARPQDVPGEGPTVPGRCRSTSWKAKRPEDVEGAAVVDQGP